MPIFEYRCSHCREIREQFFHSFESSEAPQNCRSCGSGMEKLTSRVSFHAFSPFFSNNIVPDGSRVYVRDRAQLRGLMRQYNLQEARTNHCQFGGDTRSIPLSGDPTTMGRKPRSAAPIGRMSHAQAERASREAARTGHGTRGN
jgi:putative FmdB family regulatory protein